MPKTQYKILILPYIILILLFSSCFKEDEPISPFVPPEGIVFIEFDNSIYDNQIFFDFSTQSIQKVSENSAWQLGFECGEKGFHVVINSSDFWGVINTESTNFLETEFDLSAEFWQFDASNGNLDSTAIGLRVDTTPNIFSYTNHTYILGQYDGIKYNPRKKLQLIELTDSSYSFVLANIDNSNTDTVQIIKDENYNYVHYSFENKEQITIEPLKESWDVVFSQYQTILYTDEGVPTPYFVRGTLLNPYKTTATIDSVMSYFDITKQDAYQLHFTNQKDIIGHDWKAVEVDTELNSAVYTVRDNYNYLVIDNEENYYKLQFVSYTNSDGERGFPSFQYYLIE